jgi:transcriptional regulator with XRE-family HTH domain
MAVFENRLKSLREELGKSQNEVAKAIGTTGQNLYHYENGREPNYTILMKLAEFFNVSVDYLIGYSNDKIIMKKTESNDYVEIDFSSVFKTEERLEKLVSHDDVSKLMCFYDFFTNDYNDYLKSDVVFNALPVDAIRLIMQTAKSISIKSKSEKVAQKCLQLGVKLQGICQNMFEAYLQKKGENIE